MVDDGSSEEELRKRGLELQAALPQPRGWAASWHQRKRRPSEGAEVAEGTFGLALEAGIWGVLLAIPGVIIWIVRRLRQKAAEATANLREATTVINGPLSDIARPRL